MTDSGETVPFSEELETWLHSDQEKTLGALTEVFEERSFALLFLLLMFPSALPLPTGGVTNVLEVFTMLFSLELIAGRETVWLPKRIKSHGLGEATQKKAIPFIIRRVRWFEKFSRRRLAVLFERRFFLRVVGVIVFVFTLGAFLSVPFSGLDTLPSMGVVAIALGMILGDVVVFGIGFVVGTAGIVLIVSLGAGTLELFRRIF